MRLLILVAFLSITPFLLSPPAAWGANDRQAPYDPHEHGKSLWIMDTAIQGDLGDPPQPQLWQPRINRLTQSVARQIAAQGLYRILDPFPAEDLLAKLRQRKSPYECGPCVQEVAQRLEAERVLATWVFRMSALVLTLHAILWDAQSGEVILTRTLQFRGDNDYSWDRTTDYLIRELADLQKPPQS